MTKAHERMTDLYLRLASKGRGKGARKVRRMIDRLRRIAPPLSHRIPIKRSPFSQDDTQ